MVGELAFCGKHASQVGTAESSLFERGSNIILEKKT
jgi:hypothetical protein